MQIVKNMKIKTHNLFFLLAGLTILLYLPFAAEGGLALWIIIKSFYFLGVVLFIAEVIKENRKI